jgi:hypothetical protein
VRDAEGSSVLHHIARSKTDTEAMFNEVKKHASAVVDALLTTVDCNGDTPLLVACEGELYNTEVMEAVCLHSIGIFA